MSDDFFERTELLSEMVGDGDLVGTFVVDGGPRTIPLEVGFFENHMGYRGRVDIVNYNDGGPHFVGSAIAEKHRSYLEDIADTALVGGPESGMVEAMEGMTDELSRRAPIREGTLRQSGAEFVTDNGTLVHESYGSAYGQEPR